MGKNGYLERRKVRDTVMQDAIRQTYQQYMTDMLILTLNDPEVMGKDVFGYKRLKKVLDAWGKNYDKYFDALTKKPEADYARAKIDAAMKLICGDSQDFIPFEQRYEWLPEIRYDRRGETLMSEIVNIQIGQTFPPERWLEAADNLGRAFPVIARWFELQNFEGQGKEDAEAFMSDATLALVALQFVGNCAADRCRFIAIPKKDGGKT